jgi:hypothetical protein
MGRTDYDALDRGTRIVSYGDSWLERQQNTKFIDRAGAEKTPLVREIGKNWYVRVPDDECVAARQYATEQVPLWNLLRETWASVLDGSAPFVERIGGSPRFIAMAEVAERYKDRNLSDPDTREAASAELRAVIDRYRVMDVSSQTPNLRPGDASGR